MKRFKLMLASALVAASTSMSMAQTTPAPPTQPPVRTEAPRADVTRTDDRSFNWGWLGLLGLFGLVGLARRRPEYRTQVTGTRTDAAGRPI